MKGEIGMKRIRVAVIWLVIFCGVMAGIHYFDHPEKKLYQSAVVFPVMSTRASLTFTDANEDEIDQAFRLARQEMEKVAGLCNYFDPGSELSRLNASASKEPFVCSKELWEILGEVRKFHRISGGAFDPTIRPLMSGWGFHRKRKTLPTEEEISEAKKRCGFEHVIFNDENHSVFFNCPGLSIDLGGIAKGWAVDKAAEAVLKYTSVRIGIIDLGGNMRCLPEPPPGKDRYTIAVRDPKNPDGICALVGILNECVATSGNYERYVTIQGRQYTHIIHPVTGRPVEGVLSATVVTPRGVDSDALSTALFVNGKTFADKLSADVRTLFISSDGSMTQRIPKGRDGFQIQ